ncbi:DUF4339 domain-containing protein [Rhodoblastus sp.]|uniref:DUF4339 domain-containing protein n=1 Tax=Rhodoblastus sp. TaxID=1962975 RepID=UPI0035AE61A0
MAWNYYFKDRSGAQNGPVTLEELSALAQSGRIAPDCLVWAEGGEPKPAGQHPALAGLFVGRAAAGAGGAGPLEPGFPVWGLFWRSIVFIFGMALIIPAPWVGLWFYRFIADHVALPGGARLRLESSIGESWWLFAGLGVAEMIGPAFADSGGRGAAQIVSLALSIWLTVRLIDWFCRSLRAERGGLSLFFEGGALAYFGWIVLFSLSIFTIIGWAWALKYMIRWLCAKVSGTHAFEFVGTGLDLLWRILLLTLAFAFVLPIPWALRWFIEWYVSQIVVAPRAVQQATAQALAA